MKKYILLFAALLMGVSMNAQENAQGTIKEGGIDAEHATQLTGEETQPLTLSTGWFVVNKDVSYSSTITLSGDVHLILNDGCTMNVGTSSNRVSGRGIYGGATSSLTIYGQTNGTGLLSVFTTDPDNDHISAIRVDNTYTQNGGNVHVDNAGTSYGIQCVNFTIFGGTIDATSSNNGSAIYGSATVTFSGGTVTANRIGEGVGDGISTSSSGRIILAGGTVTASSYFGTVQIADGYTYFDGNKASASFKDLDMTKTLRPVLLDDVSNTAVIEALNGQTLGSVVINGRTLYKDGKWNTLCLPFDVDLTIDGSALYGATARTLTAASITDNTLNLTFGDAVTTLAAGTPYIIKWDKDIDNPTIVNPVFKNVTISKATHNVTVENVLTFTGTYDLVPISSAGDNTKLYLGSDNKLYWPNGEMTIKCQRAYFQLADGITAGDPTNPNTVPVRAFNLNFGDDETNVITPLALWRGAGGEASEAWYTLDGRRLSGKPTAKGLYLHSTSGRLQKVIIGHHHSPDE